MSWASRAASDGHALLVRHTETQWTLDGRHTGRSDIPLTPAGREAALALGRRIAGLGPALVLVSPSLRARETCELCGLADRAQVREDLHEWDYGDYEGLTTAQILARRPGWNMWRDGCPGGEDAAAVGARADRVIAELRRTSGTCAVFSHGHALRVLGARWMELAPQQGEHLGLSTGAVCLLGFEHGANVLARWSEVGE